MKNKYAKDVGMQAIARIGGGLISFISVFILTYLFDESQIGQYNLILSSLNVIISIFTLWLSQGILRYYDGNDQLEFVFSSMFFSGILCVFSFFTFNILTKQTVSIHAYIYIFALVFYNVVDALFRKERKLLSYVVLELLLSISRLFPMIIIAILTKNYNAIFISQYLIMFIYIIIYIYKSKILKSCTLNIDKEMLCRYLKFGFPLLGLSISNWFLTSSDRYIIKYFENDYSVGIYSTNYSLANSIYMMMALIIINAFHPMIVKCWDKNKEEGVNLTSKVLNYYLIFIIPIVFYGCLKSKILLSLFKSDSYSEFNNIFVWTVLGIFVYGLSLLYHKYFELTQNTIRILVYNIFSAILNVILNFMLIPYYGFSVAAFTTFISYVFYLIIVRITTFKVFKIKFSLFNTAKIILLIIIFWLLDYLIPHPNNIFSFLIEGLIFIIYIIFTYQITKVIDLKELIKFR